jgi:zinc transport system substrate-binding protein
MKKIALLGFIWMLTLGLVACTNSKKADIVTTMFPQYDFAKQIVGDLMTVSLLIPPGAEIHDYEATSQDMVAIKEAKLFIFTSYDIDTWIKDVDQMIGDDTHVIDLSLSYVLADHMEEDEHLHETTLSTFLEADEDDHDHENENEIHFWTDPTTAIQLIEAILEKVIEIDPENAAIYEENAHDYIHEIEELHHEIEEFLMSELYHDSTIYFAGHNAMGAFGERYHLNIVSLFEGFKPDADLTSSELILFVNEVKSSNTMYLFIEELVEPKAAEKIKSELAKENYNLSLLELHGYHNITKSQMEAGVTYRDLLEQNFENIKLALNTPIV